MEKEAGYAKTFFEELRFRHAAKTQFFFPRSLRYFFGSYQSERQYFSSSSHGSIGCFGS